MKKIAIGIAVLLALLAGAAFWAYYSLDVIVKTALEHYGPDILGVDLKVGGVKLSAQDGRGSLQSVEIGNPRGFAAARAARLGEIAVAVDPATIAAPVVVIRSITVQSLQLTYERGPQGANLDAIQKHIEGYVQRAGDAAPGGPAAPAGEAAPGRRFVIERLTLRGARVLMTNPALRGQGIAFDLPDIELTDVGKRENGLKPSEIANLVANTLLQRIAQKTLTSFELLRKGGAQGALDALKGLIK